MTKLSEQKEVLYSIKLLITTEGIECKSYTTVYKDTLWKIAVTSLKDEGIEKPTNKEIKTRIALIVLLNNIEDVNKLHCNEVLQIPTAELDACISNNRDLMELISKLI